jgi:hypothetical protein
VGKHLLVVLTVLTVGCHSTTSSLRSRFATENGCPEAQVNVAASGATQYLANGCGQTTTYVCAHATMSQTDVRQCAIEDARPARSPPERERAGLPPPDPKVPMP